MHIVQKEERFDKVCEEGKSSFESIMHALWNGKREITLCVGAFFS